MRSWACNGYTQSMVWLIVAHAFCATTWNWAEPFLETWGEVSHVLISNHRDLLFIHYIYTRLQIPIVLRVSCRPSTKQGGIYRGKPCFFQKFPRNRPGIWRKFIFWRVVSIVCTTLRGLSLDIPKGYIPLESPSDPLKTGP